LALKKVLGLKTSMSGRIGKSVSLMACFAIAMHAILFGQPMAAAGAAVDPFSVICHSDPAGAPASEQAPAQHTPSQACDHCSLCAVAASATPPDAIFAGRLAPPSLLHVLMPRSHKARAHLAGSQHPARGPPQMT
jgi:hypothetical protein